MQLDLMDILNEQEQEKKDVVIKQQHDKEVQEKNVVIGMDEFEKIKSEKALNIDPDKLPWKPWNLFPEYMDCDVLAVIPPNALSSLEYSFRFGLHTRYDDPVQKAYHEIWANYNRLIWHYKPHNVDWCTAFRLLTEHRDSGKPIWMRIVRVKGQVIPLFIPECIIEVCDLT
jgi:hypothetical protein